MTARTRLTVAAAFATLTGASALFAVYDDLGWLLPVAGGIAVVAAVAEAVRRSPLPAALGPLLAAAGVTWYVVLLDARSEAYGGLVPSAGALRTVGDVARQGFSDVRSLGTPVPTRHGLVLLAVVGVAAVALVVDTLAVTLRRAALAGMPLLAVFAVAASVSRHGAGIVPFALGCTGYLVLLLADGRERLSRWGRPIGVAGQRRSSTWTSEAGTSSPVAVLGRRIGATAMVVGLVIPAVIPGLRGGLPKSGPGFGGGAGAHSVTTVNPLVSIRAQLTRARASELLRYKTDDPAPGYLRLTTLDRFDGSTFTSSKLSAGSQSKVSHGLPTPLEPGSTVSTDIRVGSLDDHWLPMAGVPTKVTVKGDWRYDPVSQTVFSSPRTTRELHYRIDAVHVSPTPTQLDAANPIVVEAAPTYVSLPDNLAGALGPIVTKVTAGADTAFRQAVALQRYLTSAPFHYSISVPASDSSDALMRFLTVTHEGFCQQYAAAMAAMARALGIPSRVAVGFTPGTRSGDEWVVTTADAHAWPELYFSGLGWVPFEPTPRGDGQAQTPAYARVGTTPGDKDPGTTSPSTNTGKDKSSAASRSEADRADRLVDTPPPATPAGTPAATARHETRLGLLLLGAALLVALAVTPALGAAVRRRQRWRQATTPAALAAAAWDDLRDTAVDAGIGWPGGLSPRAAAAAVRLRLPGADAVTDAFDRLVVAEQRARYARALRDEDVTTVRDDVARVRQAAARASTRRRRWAMRWWPTSEARRLLDLSHAAGQAVGVVDAAVARLRSRLRRASLRPAR